MSQKDVAMIFDEIFSTMLEGLKEEGYVVLSGFGSFNVRKCAVRHRYVLSTQKVVLYPENKKIILTNLVFANSIYKYVGKSKAPEH